MPQVLIDVAAEADLESIATFIGVDLHSPLAAQRFVDDINEKFTLYAHHPEMGELRPELGSVRCFTFRRKYVVLYRPISDGIDVIRILHGRDYSMLFQEE